MRPIVDAYGWGFAFLVLGLPFLMLLPKLGFALLAIAVMCFGFGRFARA
jgi:hypothetical protein